MINPNLYDFFPLVGVVFIVWRDQFLVRSLPGIFLTPMLCSGDKLGSPISNYFFLRKKNCIFPSSNFCLVQVGHEHQGMKELLELLPRSCFCKGCEVDLQAVDPSTLLPGDLISLAFHWQFTHLFQIQSKFIFRV